MIAEGHLGTAPAAAGEGSQPSPCRRVATEMRKMVWLWTIYPSVMQQWAVAVT